MTDIVVRVPPWLAVIALGLTSVASGACGRLGFDAAAEDASTIDAPAPRDVLAVAPSAFETTSTTFVDVPGGALVVPPSPGQRWLLLVSGSIQSSSGQATGVEVRYLVDGVEQGIGGTESVVVGRPGPWQHVYVFDGADRPLPVTLQLADTQGTTARLEDAHLAVIPLPAPDTATTASADAPTVVNTSATLVPVLTLTLTVPTAGDYVALLLTNASERPAASDVFWQWLDPDGQPWTRSMHNPRPPWQSSLFVREVTLPAGPLSVTLQGRSGGMGTLRYTRLVLLRRADFTAGLALQTTTGGMTAVVPPLVTNQLAPVLGAARSYVVLGSADITDTCVAMGAERGAYFRVDADERTTYHVNGNCTLDTTYGMLDVRATAPTLIAAGISAGNTTPVIHQASTLLVFGVP